MGKLSGTVQAAGGCQSCLALPGDDDDVDNDDDAVYDGNNDDQDGDKDEDEADDDADDDNDDVAHENERYGVMIEDDRCDNPG